MFYLRQRTKKEEKVINVIKIFLIFVASLVGWYQIGGLTGIITGLLTAIGLLALFGKWQSDRLDKD